MTMDDDEIMVRPYMFVIPEKIDFAAPFLTSKPIFIIRKLYIKT